LEHKWAFSVRSNFPEESFERGLSLYFQAKETFQTSHPTLIKCHSGRSEKNIQKLCPILRILLWICFLFYFFAFFFTFLLYFLLFFFIFYLFDLFFTGGELGLNYFAIPLMLLVGFLTPWPYNYWRLEKYGVSCH
jgi:hypothetical protein